MANVNKQVIRFDLTSKLSLCYCLLTVNGGWSTWTSWSMCSSSVARGISQRQRTCSNPTPSALGRDCNGDSTDKRPCPGNEQTFKLRHIKSYPRGFHGHEQAYVAKGAI